MCRKRLDMKETFPSGMEEYLSTYGWHFSKKMCEHAISKMRRKNPRTGESEPLTMMKKEEFETLLRRYGVEPTDFMGYDAMYVYHMAKADFFESSIIDEPHLIKYVKDYLEDPDGYDEVAMTRYYADCIGKGEMPDWEDCL